MQSNTLYFFILMSFLTSKHFSYCTTKLITVIKAFFLSDIDLMFSIV